MPAHLPLYALHEHNMLNNRSLDGATGEKNFSQLSPWLANRRIQCHRYFCLITYIEQLNNTTNKIAFKQKAFSSVIVSDAR